jgi:dihydrolipoamide dehydrogenase
MEKFDIVVIGGGPGGYAAAISASQEGASVALIEKAVLGGTCLNWGCISTKALIASSKLFAQIKSAEKMGLNVTEAYFDYEAISKHKNILVAKLRSGTADLLKANGVAVFKGTASYISRNLISIRDGKTVIEASNTIISTGSKSSMPSFLPKNRRVVDSRGFLEANKLPPNIIILGGGIIGCELACMASQLGVKVTLIEMLEDILTILDSDIRQGLRNSMENDLSIRVLTGKQLNNIRVGKDSVGGKFGKERIEAELLLVAVGRDPETEGLALRNTGVATNKAGYIETDEFCRTSVPSIFAVGDVTGGPQLAHAATSQGITAAENAYTGKRRRKETVVPACIFTSPEIGTVGLTENEAKKRGIAVKIGRFPFSALGRALNMGDQSGFVKWVVDADTEQLLGAHTIGPHATELIAEAAVAIRAELTVHELEHTIHCHPTLAEAWMEAAYAAQQKSIHLMPRKKRYSPDSISKIKGEA